MTKEKYLFMILFASLLLLLLPNVSNAAVEVKRNMYANDGSSKYEFTGLTLDTSHEYEFGLTKTKAETVETWHLLTEYTESTATVNITGSTYEFAQVIRAVETGYITIREKKDNEKDTVVLEHQAVDLSIPYLNITNYSVINNGKDLTKSNIQVSLWNAGNSEPYYQYEKITDEKIISKYKEIKAKNGDYNDLQSLLKTQAPSSNWSKWKYWNSHDGNGIGYPEGVVKVPDSGLYYMWFYFSGENIRTLYGYILVDNLEGEIALDSISLPQTKEVELGQTLTLTPGFQPNNATNKIVTWSSSDESVATVDNAGKVTPKKIGSTIITVTSQDGKKKATCTVTVKQNANEQSSGAPASGTQNSAPTNTGDTNGGATNSNPPSSETPTTSSPTDVTTSSSSVSGTTLKLGSSNGNDQTVAVNTLPRTGVKKGIIALLIALIGTSIFSYMKTKKYKGI